MNSYHSYPKIWNIGHANIKEIFLEDVNVEEKIDGSQFSFGIFDGVLKCRSKGVELDLNAPEKMFKKAVETVKSREKFLTNGYTYRGEYLEKPKHNTLAYNRVPTDNIILFDVNTGMEEYMPYEQKKLEAEKIGLEVVPQFFFGKVTDVEQLKAFLEQPSILGGQKIEGFVIKNYARFDRFKQAMLGKFVSEAFKEIHQGDWRDRNPTPNTILDKLIVQYKTPARWDKAIQHLKERGELENSPKDIGKLLVEVKADLNTECGEEIKQKLLNWAIEQIERGVIAGFPQYYKTKLLESAFAEEKVAVNE